MVSIYVRPDHSRMGQYGLVMLRAVALLMVVCWGLLGGSGSRLTCSKVMQERRPEFHLVAPCSISGMTIIARTNTTSVKRCSQFANLKRGLAFNFKLPEKKRTTPENCLIYDCPESDTLQSIRREKDFDYYSLYADPLPTEHTVCVVSVGMFRLHEEHLNYSEAMKACLEEGGELASVLSAKRTNGLSGIVSELRGGQRVAYVGLNDMESEGRFVSMSGRLASCYEYRAWGLGEPRGRKEWEDCVVVNGEGQWKVVDCRRKLPFLCELLPKGPFPLPDEGVSDPCKKKYYGHLVRMDSESLTSQMVRHFLKRKMKPGWFVETEKDLEERRIMAKDLHLRDSLRRKRKKEARAKEKPMLKTGRTRGAEERKREHRERVKEVDRRERESEGSGQKRERE